MIRHDSSDLRHPALPIAIPTATSRQLPLRPRLSKPRRKLSLSSSASTLSLKRLISINSIKSSLARSPPKFASRHSSVISIDDDFHPLQEEFTYASSLGYDTDSTSLDESFHHYTLKKSASPPLSIPRKSSSLATTTETVSSRVASSSNSSTDLLIKLLHDHDDPPRKRVSQLTHSLRLLRTLLQRNLVTYAVSVSPRMTDDVIPKELVVTPMRSPEFEDYLQPCLNDCELQTYTLTGPQDQDMIRIPAARAFRNRDERINLAFLHLYAQDCTAREMRLLPGSCSNEEFVDIHKLAPGVRDFHQLHNMYKIAHLSRNKLWDLVILPPRKDKCPSACIDPSCYIYVGDSCRGQLSLTRKHGTFSPWLLTPRAPSMRPAGILQGVKGCENGPSPSSGVTKPQFTIRGWCNSRWLDLNDYE